MRRSQSAALPADLDQLRKQVERWRRTRQKLSPMPAALWRAAERQAAVHGCSAVARATGIGYGSLRKRLGREAGANGAASFRRKRPTFIELAPIARDGSRIELEDRDGVKLTIRLGDLAPLDIAIVASSIWERRR